MDHMLLIRPGMVVNKRFFGSFSYPHAFLSAHVLQMKGGESGYKFSDAGILFCIF
jgi:hypothetical protein